LTNSFPDILKVRNTEVSPPKLPLIIIIIITIVITIFLLLLLLIFY
jgi:hypothetical protein